MIRGLALGVLIALPGVAAAQGLIYSLPGGASSDTISTPNGFAAPRGVYYFAVSTHTEPEAGDRLDAVVAMGAGTGSVASAVELSLVTADVSRFSGHFLNVKWHFHNETASAPAVAVGIEDITASESRSATVYVAATKTFWDTSARSAFLMRKAVSAGFGGGRFLRRPFGAVSVSLDAFSKAIVEHDGRGLNVGVSVSRPVGTRAAAVIVLARQHLTKPSERAWTASAALAWSHR